MVIGKCTDVFRGIFWLGEGLRRGRYFGGTFHQEVVMGEENFHEGSAGFSRIINRDSGVTHNELGQNLSFSVKSEVLTGGGLNPLIYVIKT